MKMGETGHAQNDDLLRELQYKDRRIHELEEEMERMRVREKELIHKLE